MNRFLTRLTALMLTLALLLAPLALAEDTPDGAIDEGAEYEEALQNEPKVTVSQDELAITPGLDPDWVNILLAGSDSRTGKGYSRTDAMIILSLNVRSGQVRMTSVMRDIWTPMHGRAPQKINACTVFGGPTLAMRTLNEDFRMNIEDYVLIGMQAIEAVIDLIGGVELDITEQEFYALKKSRNATDTDLITPPEAFGTVTLTGEQALAYARLRAIDGVKSVTPTIEAEPGAFDYQVESAENVDIRRPAFFALAQAGYPVLRLTNQDLSLEEVFVRLTENKPSARPEKKKKTADAPSAQEEKQQ